VYDVVLVRENPEEVNEKYEEWRTALEEKGPRFLIIINNQ